MTEHDLRRRLLLAAERVVSQQGSCGVTAEAVAAAAGLAESAFEATFADDTDCLLAALDCMVDELRSRMRVAKCGAPTWVDGIRAALLACLGFFDEDPRRAQFMVLETLAGEPAMRARRERLLGDLTEGLESHRPNLTEDGEAQGSAQAVVSAVATVIHARLSDEPVPKLKPLGRSLMGVIVLPYLGSVAARGELEREAA
jgi:AcrR family transcriptional regulator